MTKQQDRSEITSVLILFLCVLPSRRFGATFCKVSVKSDEFDGVARVGQFLNETDVSEHVRRSDNI